MRCTGHRAFVRDCAPEQGGAPEFAARLLEWYERAGRKHLPWQRDPTPYRVWISEIMLQQTQVATVIPYYERFMQHFPDVVTLARAPLDTVLHLWTGLGYYARARNLHRAAQHIVAEHGGAFPTRFEAVQALPGIGRSTAGAILALSCGARHPILDGNAKRVLARHFGVEGFPGDSQVAARLWALADRCTPSERVAEYTQAIMDLGATVCTRTRPQCAACPVRPTCVAQREGRSTALPTPRPKRSRVRRRAFVLLAVNATGAVLLERRPPLGIWGGLWTLPQFDSATEALAFLASASEATRLPPYEHAFTHFDLELHPLLIRTVERLSVADGERYTWYDVRHPAKIGLAKPTADLIRRLTPQD